MWQQQRPHRSTQVPAKGCPKPQAWPCSQADHLACSGGDPTFTGLQMMLLLAGLSPSLGHRMAVVAQNLKTFLNALCWSRCHPWPRPGVYPRVRCINPDQKSPATPAEQLLPQRWFWGWDGHGSTLSLSMALSVFLTGSAKDLAGVSCLKAWRPRIKRKIPINSCWGNPKI